MSFHIYHYCLPYRQAVLLKQGLFRQREGYLLQDQELENNFAEVAPLPGLHTETLAECLVQLQQVQRGQSLNLSPSVAWGLDMLKKPISHSVAQPLAINALLSGNDWTILEQQCQFYYQQGYRHFKLKVGFGKASTELSLIQRVAERYPDLRLRLDANRCWNLRDALKFCKDLPLAGIDYLEEPFQNPTDIQAFQQSSDLAIAWDESLTQGLAPIYQQAAAVWVLKPMLLGPRLTRKLIQTAQENGKRLIFSSVFESGIGLRYLAQLAQQQSPHEAAGLDTWRAFQADLCEPGFCVEKGQVDFSSSLFTAPLRLRLDALSLIKSPG